MINTHRVNEILEEQLNLRAVWLFGRSVPRGILNSSIGNSPITSSLRKRQVLIICGLIDESIKEEVQLYSTDNTIRPIAYVFLGSDSINGANLFGHNIFYRPEDLVERPLLLNDINQTNDELAKLILNSLDGDDNESH